MNTNTKRIQELNFSSPSSNELNIFDSTDPKYHLRPHFFRLVTKTLCETTNEEEKNIVDKIRIYNNQIIKIKDHEKDMFSLDKQEEKIMISNLKRGIGNN